MSKELFDLVDEQDNVIGTTDKKTAHENGHLHRVAAVFVFNQDGELYVQEHNTDGKWDHSVGGHLSKGETYAKGAVREAEEELGITQELEELATAIYADETPSIQHHFFGLYTCVADPEWEFVPNDEVKVIFPMTLAEIRQQMIDDPLKFTAGFRITMSEYVRLKGLE